MKTTQITIRNVDATLKQRIDKLAQLKAMSLNDFMLDILRTKVNGNPDAAMTWQRYSGMMDKAAINQNVLGEFEAIDSTMWNHE